MSIHCIEVINFASTRVTNRFEHVVPAGSEIIQINKINDRFTAFKSPVLTNRNGVLIELYCDTNRLHNNLEELTDLVTA